jgi:hypothetical protein
VTGPLPPWEFVRERPHGKEEVMLILILGIIAAVLSFLDLVLWQYTTYKRHILLQFAVLVVSVAVILGAVGIGTGALH